jgi:hypothetical protein
MNRKRQIARRNAKSARRLWADLSASAIESLRYLTSTYGLSVDKGDIIMVEHRWYITHTGLLGIAARRRCAGIRVQQVREFCDSTGSRWVFKATVFKDSESRGFVGYGDADPSNVSTVVRGAEMRVAETRAVNRALRKAYGIGLCSVEELGSFSSSSPIGPARGQHNGSHPPASHPCSNGQPRLRDRLCLLIRQHHLDASLVKSYAADYCGTATLREASRDLVEAFISHLAEWATKDREGLVSKLNSYAKSQEQELRA